MATWLLPHFLKSADGALGVCRSERVRPRLAALALVGVLLGQTLVPCGLMLSSVHAAELRLKKAAPGVAPKAQIPSWARDLEKRAAQQQREQKLRLAQFGKAGKGDKNDAPSQDDLECLDCEVALEPLDLSEVPTEKALRRAGGVDGALYPMRRAEPEELGVKLDLLLKRIEVPGGLRGQLPPKDPRFAATKRAQERYARARAINTLFGRAIKAWEQNERDEAIDLFQQYMEQYPKSPWSGEAFLHLGYAAKDAGRLVEAAEIFEQIVEKTSDKPNKKLREQKRERKQRGGGPLDSERQADVSKALEGATSFEEAVNKLDSSAEIDGDDESFEIHMKAKQQLADVDMLMGHYNAAQQKLSEIIRDDLNWRRRLGASSELQRANFLSKNGATLMACGPQSLGVVLASLDKSDDHTEAAKAPRVQGFSMAELKTLALQSGVKMDGFKAQPGELAQLPLPAILHYDFGPDAPATGRTVQSASNGHFVVLQGVDAKSKMVRVYDPSQKSAQRMSYAQLQKQWSGQGLAVEKKGVRLAVAPLDAAAMKGAMGGQTSAPNRNVGDSGNNASSAGGDGAPSVEFNRFSMNQHIEHMPLSYEPTRGPSVDISVTFNSQDTISQYQKFGHKWMFNYTTYAYESGTRIYVVMPDGSRGEYIYDPANPSVFKGLPGNFSTIEKSGGAYTLVFQDGSRWIYNRTGAAVNFVSRMEDPYQLGLDFLYDGSNRLAIIRDADSRDTTLFYNAQNLVERVEAPFGRTTTFTYFNNHLYGCVDTAGRAFEYRYGGPIVSRLTTAEGVWLYNQTGPAPGSASTAITVTNPLSDSMSYSYNASTYISTETDYKGNGTEYGFISGPSEELMSRVVYPYDGRARGAVVVEFNEIGSVKTAYNEAPFNYPLGYWGKSEFTYNLQGEVSTTKDGNQYITAFNYDPGNGVDVTSVVNANNARTMDVVYNTQHQPVSVTDLSTNGTATFGYTAWGALVITIDPLGRGTRYVYGTAGDDLRRLIAVQVSDAPASLNGAGNWVTVSSFTSDAAGRVLTTKDETTGLVIGYEYDLADRVTAVKYPDATREETTYLNGLPVRGKDRAGRYSYTEYDALGRAKRSYTQDAQNGAQVGTVSMDYDKNSNLTLLTDSKGKNTSWSYDSRDRMVLKTYHDGKSEGMAYDHGLLLSDRYGSYGYDKNGNLTTVTYPNSTNSIKFDYNRLNDVWRVQDLAPVEWRTFTYDNYGRLMSQGTDSLPNEQSYTYDKLQRVQTHTVGAHTQTNSYDALDRLASINSTGQFGTGLTTYGYAGNSDRLTELTHPNGTKTRQQYDGLGRVTYIFNSANGDAFHNRYAIGYDTRDLKVNRQSRTGSANPLTTTFYTYDALDQLKQERVIGGVAGTPYTTNYNYDAMGNRLQVDTTSTAVNGTSSVATTTSVPNDLNQLTSLTTTRSNGPTTSATLTYGAYNPNSQTVEQMGNLTRVLNNDGTSTEYDYDVLDRLVRIQQKNTAGTILAKSDFFYDYAGRRVISQSFAYSASTGKLEVTENKRRIYDGMDLVQERNHTNSLVQTQIVRDGNIGGILSRTTSTNGATSNGAIFYGYDDNGNVSLLTDANGADVGHYRYDAFGNTLEADGPRAAENPFRFSTKELHAPSGLYDFGFRFYSAAMGRWMNRDPLEEEGGINLYAMVGNNPVNDVDAYGLAPAKKPDHPCMHDGIPNSCGPGQGHDPYVRMPQDDIIDRGKTVMGMAAIDALGAFVLRGKGKSARPPIKAAQVPKARAIIQAARVYKPSDVMG